MHLAAQSTNYKIYVEGGKRLQGGGGDGSIDHLAIGVVLIA